MKLSYFRPRARSLVEVRHAGWIVTLAAERARERERERDTHTHTRTHTHVVLRLMHSQVASAPCPLEGTTSHEPLILLRYLAPCDNLGCDCTGPKIIER